MNTDLLKFWLGFKCIAKRGDYYVITRKFFLFIRVYYDSNDGGWWHSVYQGSRFNSFAQAKALVDSTKLRPVREGE